MWVGHCHLDSNPGTGPPTHIYPGLSRIAGFFCPWKKALCSLARQEARKAIRAGHQPVSRVPPVPRGWLALCHHRLFPFSPTGNPGRQISAHVQEELSSYEKCLTVLPS